MSDSLTERIKHWASIQPDHLMSAFASDLNEIVNRAEAAEARAAQLQFDLNEAQINIRLMAEHNTRITAERDEARRQLAEAQARIAELEGYIDAHNKRVLDNLDKSISAIDEAAEQIGTQQ